MSTSDHVRRVFLHVGLPKTGTTYVQDRLWRNRDAALRQGLLYPGDTDREAHFHGAVHLQPHRYLDWVDTRHDGAWERLVGQVSDWPSSSIISHELLATATDKTAAKAIRSLDFAEVHVVCTVRDLARQIPSVWQENIKNQYTTTFAEFVGSIRDPQRKHDPFWEFQNVPRILRTWGRDLPADRVHVVTVPPSGSSPDLLWERFTTALDVPVDRLRRDLPPSNDSLDAAQIEIVRRLNADVRGEIDWARYESVVKDLLIGKIMLAKSDRRAPTLPHEELPWLQDITDGFVADIRAAGYHIVGDLADLEPRAAPTEIRPEATAEDMLTGALAALTKIVQMMPEPDPAPDHSVADRIKISLRRRYRRLVAAGRALSARSHDPRA